MNKISYLGSVKVINNEYTLKKEKELTSIYEYLSSRDFHNYLNPIERIDGYNKYLYLKDKTLANDQKNEDLALVVALLHNKTSYYKSINLDKYTEIYDNLIGYINYLEEYYKDMLKKIEYVLYPSPSQTLFLSNYYKLDEVFIFLKKELLLWYNNVKSENKARVVLNHGNLSIDHFISDKLISWDKANFDTPIIDVVNYVHNEWDNVDISVFLSKYLEKFSLTDNEKKLLFINLSIPHMITLNDDEFFNVCDVRKLYDYLFKIESSIRPYYTVNNKE